MGMNASAAEVVAAAGLDGWLWIRFLTLTFKFSAVLTLAALIIIIPTNLAGGGGGSTLAAISMANISNSNLLWIHLLFMYGFNIGAMYILHKLYKEYIVWRHASLAASMPRNYTALATNLPRKVQPPQQPAACGCVAWPSHHPARALRLPPATRLSMRSSLPCTRTRSCVRP